MPTESAIESRTDNRSDGQSISINMQNLVISGQNNTESDHGDSYSSHFHNQSNSSSHGHTSNQDQGYLSREIIGMLEDQNQDSSTPVDSDD